MKNLCEVRKNRIKINRRRPHLTVNGDQSGETGVAKPSRLPHFASPRPSEKPAGEWISDRSGAPGQGTVYH